MANPAGAMVAWPGVVAAELGQGASRRPRGLRRILMHAVIRKYTSPPEARAESLTKMDQIEQIMRGVPGFVAYYFVETDDGIATVTITEDERGATDSMERAAKWVRENRTSGAGARRP